MLKIKKIQRKIEIKDVAVQDDPCRVSWDKYRIPGDYDCLYDCTDPTRSGAYASPNY